MTEKPLDPQILALTEQVGVFINYWGFKSIEGKIWCLTFISNHPLGPSDYMNAFGISKGLVSQSVKRLVEYKVIIEVSKPEKKKQFYKANDELLDVIKNVLKVRELEMLRTVESSAIKVEKLNKDELEQNHININQVQKILELTNMAKLFLDMILSRDNINSV